MNSSLHADIGKYEKLFQKAGVTVDKETLSRSWRCGITVCDFIRTHLQIDMQSQHTYETEIIPLSNQVDANAVHADGEVVKLFYQEHYKYGCLSNNWGASKGLDHYNDVCVVLGTTHWKIYQTSSPTAQKNKLYVAFSRTRGKLYLAPEKLFKPFKTM
ncbi:hypothetical protein [Pseudomonas sp. SST3]|uniref:hypothetical protein n=1 Tax=Pseudomonas sp. SST3 TaxID=2267882 RepID=UPI001F509AF1|nr:hypothetical protein [Pseudomonas sp. SST3]